jgi:hypothetical protein
MLLGETPRPPWRSSRGVFHFPPGYRDRHCPAHDGASIVDQSSFPWHGELVFPGRIYRGH